MNDFEKLINASDLIEWIMETYPDWCVGDVRGIVDHIDNMSFAQPERCEDCGNFNKTRLLIPQPDIVRCKDCKHQEKYFHADGRRKDSGYYILGCDLARGYSHVCLDDDFCSRAERKE